MKTIYMTSIVVRVVLLLTNIGLIALAYLMFFKLDEPNIIASIYMGIVLIFCTLGTYISFSHKLILKDDHLISRLIHKKIFPYSDIISIKVQDDILDNSIYIETTKALYKISGYFMFNNRKKQLIKTQQIVDEISTHIDIK